MAKLRNSERPNKVKISITREYRSWQFAIQRCHNPHNNKYYLYGGRGIIVCDRWRNSFTNFLSDVGIAPSSKHTLDRKDANGNYDPDNCRWATVFEQNRNKRNTIWWEYKGVRKRAIEWCEELGLNYNRVITRSYNGWSIDRCLSTPTGIRKRLRAI